MEIGPIRASLLCHKRLGELARLLFTTRGCQSSQNLSPAEIKELGLELVIPVAEIQEARRMCQKLHPDRGGDPEAFQMWKEKLDRLKRRVRR